MERSFEYGYDRNGALISVENSRNATSGLTYDAVGQVVTVGTLTGAELEVSYDERGFLSGTTSDASEVKAPAAPAPAAAGR